MARSRHRLVLISNLARRIAAPTTNHRTLLPLAHAPLDRLACSIAARYISASISCPPFYIADGNPSSMPLTLPYCVLRATGITVHHTTRGSTLVRSRKLGIKRCFPAWSTATCCDSNHCWWRLTSSIIGGSPAHHPRVLGSVPNLHAHHVQQTKATSLLLVSMTPTDLYRSSM